MLNILRRFLPAVISPVDSHFEQLKEQLYEALKKELASAFKKCSKNERLSTEKPDLKFVKREALAELSEIIERDFNQAIQIGYRKDVPGLEQGHLKARNQVEINISPAFNQSCQMCDICLSTVLQECGVSYLSGKGYNVKGFQPLVTTHYREPG